MGHMKEMSIALHTDRQRRSRTSKEMTASSDSTSSAHEDGYLSNTGTVEHFSQLSRKLEWALWSTLSLPTSSRHHFREWANRIALEILSK